MILLISEMNINYFSNNITSKIDYLIKNVSNESNENNDVDLMKETLKRNFIIEIICNFSENIDNYKLELIFTKDSIKQYFQKDVVLNQILDEKNNGSIINTENEEKINEVIKDLTELYSKSLKRFEFNEMIFLDEDKFQDYSPAKLTPYNTYNSRGSENEEKYKIQPRKLNNFPNYDELTQSEIEKFSKIVKF